MTTAELEAARTTWQHKDGLLGHMFVAGDLPGSRRDADSVIEALKKEVCSRRSLWPESHKTSSQSKEHLDRIAILEERLAEEILAREGAEEIAIGVTLFLFFLW